MDELIKYQESVIETINQENEKCDELNSELNLDQEIKLATIYKSKLVQICKDILLIKDKSEKIKQRAIKLQERKQKEALKAEQTKDKQKQMDNQIEPVVLAKNKAKKKYNKNNIEENRDDEKYDKDLVKNKTLIQKDGLIKKDNLIN